MNETNITEIFCEVLSGLAIFFFLMPLFDVIGISSISSSLNFLVVNFNVTMVATLLFLSYIVGLVMDAIGLAVGELFLDRWLCKDSLTKEERAAFLKNVSSHVLGYRDTQWAYASAYRNLAILMIPGGLLWVWCIGSSYGWKFAAGVLLCIIILELSLLKSIAILLKLYVFITKSSLMEIQERKSGDGCSTTIKTSG